MDFRGHLRLPDDAGTGIPVLLRLDDIFVVISSGGDELGAWRADDVVIERIYSNQFAIELDGEPMVFVAQDALGFAYEGISAIEGVQERLTKRRVFRRSKKKEKAAAVEQEPKEPAVEEPTGTQDPPVPPPSAPPVPTFEEATPEPVAAADDAEEPVMWGQPAAIWTPPSADTSSRRTPTAPSDPQPDFEPVVPEPIERRFESEDADARRPEDTRVSYPQPEQPPAPAVETFVPPAEPDEPAVEAREPVSPDRRDEPAVEAGEPVSPAPVSRDEHTPAEVEPAVETPEYEIEEVAPAASGVSWQADDESYPDEEEPAAEFEIEDYVLPSAGAIETFNPPGAEADPEPAVAAPPEPTEVEAAPDASEGAEIDDAAESAETAVPSDPEPPTEAAETPDVVAASNGHRDELEADSSKRERRHSLFGRSRDKKIPPHEHRYGDPKTIGGLTRQVCEVCGHVTFSGEDVYQGW